MAGILNSNNQAAVLAGVGPLTYVAGGPIVHLVHGHGWRAGGSLLLRVGLPSASAIALAVCTRENSCLEQVLTAFAIGGLAASVLDLSLLHWEEEEEPRSSSIMPLLHSDGRSLQIGAIGTF